MHRWSVRKYGGDGVCGVFSGDVVVVAPLYTHSRIHAGRLGEDCVLASVLFARGLNDISILDV